MAPRPPLVPTAASERPLRSTARPSSQQEGIPNPGESISVETQTQTLQEATISSTESNRSGRRRNLGTRRVQDQLAAQAKELAELKALLQRQFQPIISDKTQGKLPRRNTPYVAEPDDPLLSVEEVELDQTPFSGLPTTRRSAETPDPGDGDRYSRRKPYIKDPKRLNDRVEPTWTSWVIAIDNKLEQDTF